MIHSAQREAEALLALVGQNGETVETLRAGIPVSNDARNKLTDLFAEAFADSVARDREDILQVFDALVRDGSAAKQTERLARYRERLRRRRIIIAAEHSIYRREWEHKQRRDAKGNEWD